MYVEMPSCPMVVTLVMLSGVSVSDFLFVRHTRMFEMLYRWCLPEVCSRTCFRQISKIASSTTCSSKEAHRRASVAADPSRQEASTEDGDWTRGSRR